MRALAGKLPSSGRSGHLLPEGEGEEAPPRLQLNGKTQYRSSSNNYCLNKGFLQGRSAPMFRAFLGEPGHLALDYTRVDSIAARLDPLLDQLRRQPRLQDLQATRERQPVDIEILPLGRLQHQCSYHEVAKRQGVQLLLHTLRRLAAQVRGLGRAPGILVRLVLVKDEFFFPTLMVVTRQFQSREQRVIEQVSRQTM